MEYSDADYAVHIRFLGGTEVAVSMLKGYKPVTAEKTIATKDSARVLRECQPYPWQKFDACYDGKRETEHKVRIDYPESVRLQLGLQSLG